MDKYPDRGIAELGGDQDFAAVEAQVGGMALRGDEELELTGRVRRCAANVGAALHLLGSTVEFIQGGTGVFNGSTSSEY